MPDIITGSTVPSELVRQVLNATWDLGLTKATASATRVNNALTELASPPTMSASSVAVPSVTEPVVTIPTDQEADAFNKFDSLYPELIDALRAALAAPQPEPVALCDALRWSGAKESHGTMMFSPDQLRKFYEFASRAAPPAAPAPAPDDGLKRAYALGWITAASWAKRDDLLNRLNDDLPMLLSEMNANPETAMVLERMFAEASARGITT